MTSVIWSCGACLEPLNYTTRAAPALESRRARSEITKILIEPAFVSWGSRDAGAPDGETVPGLLVFPQFIIQLPRKEPTHAEHVDRRPDGATAEPVFALAEFSRPMIHRDLD